MKSLVVSVPQPKFVYAQTSPYSSFRSNITYFIKRYGLITFFIIMLFAGMITGAVRAGSADESLLDGLDILFSSNIAVRGEQTLAKTFINSFGTSFMFLALFFCLSLSPLGVIAIPLIMFFRGFGYGISSGFLCITYGLKGLVYYIFVMLLGAFISSLALIYASQYCFDFSKSMIVLIFSREGLTSSSLKGKLGTLFLNCSYMIILIIFASLLDTGLYYLIGGLFSF